MVVRSVYKDWRKVGNFDDWGDWVCQAWNYLHVQYIKNLYKSIPNRLVSVFDKKGCCTDYLTGGTSRNKLRLQWGFRLCQKFKNGTIERYFI